MCQYNTKITIYQCTIAGEAPSISSSIKCQGTFNLIVYLQHMHSSEPVQPLITHSDLYHLVVVDHCSLAVHLDSPVGEVSSRSHVIGIICRNVLRWNTSCRHIVGCVHIQYLLDNFPKTNMNHLFLPFPIYLGALCTGCYACCGALLKITLSQITEFLLYSLLLWANTEQGHCLTT